MAEVGKPLAIDNLGPEREKPVDGSVTGTNGNLDRQTDHVPNAKGDSGQQLQHQNSIGSPEPLPSDDLSEELLQMGWRKYWSKRENMPYYFNKITNESLWELPQVVHVSVTLLISRPSRRTAL